MIKGVAVQVQGRLLATRLEFIVQTSMPSESGRDLA